MHGASFPVFYTVGKNNLYERDRQTVQAHSWSLKVILSEDDPCNACNRSRAQNDDDVKDDEEMTKRMFKFITLNTIVPSNFTHSRFYAKERKLFCKTSLMPFNSTSEEFCWDDVTQVIKSFLITFSYCSKYRKINDCRR